MKITNKYNLPSGFVNAAADDEAHLPKDKHYSVTTILKPDRMILLERRHFNEIEDDCSNRVWQIFGTAVHSILEQADKSGNTELAFDHEVKNGYFLTGRIDRLNLEQGLIEDYKTASVWKINKADFEDWRKQGLMYAWLVLKSGQGYINKLKFHAMLKDWTAIDKKKASFSNSYYPERQVYTWEYDISSQDYIEIEKFIEERFDSLIASEKLSDIELTVCSASERWNDGTRYAVKKIGAVKAFRICDTYEEARTIADSNTSYIVEKREGEDKRCNYYCSACEFCSHKKGN